jgi:hypothetical protein
MPLNLGDLKIRSSAFASLGRIPKRNAGDGENLSPPLEWSGAPSRTREFALVCHDPDAPLAHGFTHWVLYGIPPSTTKLAEGQASDAFTAGVNSAGQRGYMGPYPPSGHGPHHYYFWVYALDAPLGLKPGLRMDQLLAAIEGHVLEQARTVGIYER